MFDGSNDANVLLVSQSDGFPHSHVVNPLEQLVQCCNLVWLAVEGPEGEGLVVREYTGGDSHCCAPEWGFRLNQRDSALFVCMWITPVLMAKPRSAKLRMKVPSFQPNTRTKRVSPSPECYARYHSYTFP